MGAHLAWGHVPLDSPRRLRGFASAIPSPICKELAACWDGAGVCHTLPEARAAGLAAHRHPGHSQPLGEEEEGQEQPIQMGFVHGEENQWHARLQERRPGLSAWRAGGQGQG